eukprot:5437609-Pyramimonas_sp.AAC.1
MDNPHTGGCIIYAKPALRAILSNIRHRVLAEGRIHSIVLHNHTRAAQVVNIHSDPGIPTRSRRQQLDRVRLVLLPRAQCSVFVCGDFNFPAA